MAGFGEKQQSDVLSFAQNNLTQEQEFFRPEAAVNSLLKRLENSPGMKDNIATLQYYARNTDFVETKEMPAAIGYDPNADVIRYNPDQSLPSDTDRTGIFIHELAHRADVLGYQVTQIPKWAGAIQKAETVIAETAGTVQSWFVAGGKYEKNAFFSDIVSAISKGRINTVYSHSEDYWAKPGNREREIFANMAVLDALYGRDGLPLEDGFETIFEVFKEIINGGLTL